MIEIVLAHTDLVRVRFAHSPVEELVASLRVLQDPGRQHMYDRWMLTDQLDAIAATPTSAVRAELDEVREGGPLPTALRPSTRIRSPTCPRWSRGCNGTGRSRSSRSGSGCGRSAWPTWPTAWSSSPAAASCGCSTACIPDVAFERDLLRISKPHHQCHHHFDLTGTGILLVPCVFTWPTLSVDCCGVDQPVLVYPPRGLAELWREPPAAQPDALAAPVGRTRATLLAMVDLPRTTTQLAEQLDLSPAAVSEHLRILRETALVTARRRGRMVLYQRTSAATALLAAIRSGQATG